MPRIKAHTVIEHRENQRAKILASARAIVKSDGIDALNFSSVADRAGLARPSLYEYFKSKPDLMLALALDEFPPWRGAIEAAMKKQKNPSRKIETFFSKQIEMVSEGRHAFAFQVGKELDDKSKEQIHSLHMDLLSLLEEPMAALGIRVPDEGLALIGGVLHSSMDFARSGADGNHTIGKMAAEFALAGIKSVLTKGR